MESLAPLREAPHRAAIFCDVDGTLAPIVARPENARVPDRSARLLGMLARRYACVACVSGRSVAEARRLVGVGGIAYVGTHGAELLEPGASRPALAPGFARWEERVRKFGVDHDSTDSRMLRLRIEDKGPIVAFHWRGAPDEEAARRHLDDVAAAAEAEGFHVHWGRKVLEVRPPIEISKGQGVRELARGPEITTALFGGDDRTDLDGFEALTSMVEAGELDGAVLVGVRSEEGPREIVDRADLVVDGVGGFAEVLEALARG
jgi:trehalose 6-phosphate phosphatase